MEHRTLTVTTAERAPETAALYRNNPRPSVFARSADEVQVASKDGVVVHTETPDGEMTSTAGVYDRAFESFNVGGVLVIDEGFGLQAVLMRILGCTLHLSHERYGSITAAVFTNNVASIINIERAGFVLFRNAPADLVADLTKKADGKPYRLYHLPPAGVSGAARWLVKFSENPILRSSDGREMELELRHPLFTIWMDALRQLAFIEDVDAGNS